MTSLIVAFFALVMAIYIMITIERLRVHDWWRYGLYIFALVVAAAASFGILHSTTQRIGIVCAVLVLSWRSLAGRASALQQQSGASL